MGARFIVLFTHALLSYGLTVNRSNSIREIISSSKSELKSLIVPCKLNDIVIISAPIIQSSNIQYHLYKPTGDIVILNLGELGPQEKSEVRITPIKDEKSVERKKYRVANMIRGKGDFNKIEENMEPSEFAIGPVIESYHGNWVLSVYYQDINGDWMEFFQVISIEILENVPPRSSFTELFPGESFNPSFAYPIKGLQSCEIIAPKSTFDRYYDRNLKQKDMCGYDIHNVTKADLGRWTIIGVGNIVYKTEMNLFIFYK